VTASKKYEAERGKPSRISRTLKKAALPTTSVDNKKSHNEVATRNVFSPLRTTNRDTDAAGLKSALPEGAVSERTGQPPRVVLTSEASLIPLQKQIKGVAEQSFELRTTRNGTEVITKDMVECLAVKGQIDTNNLAYFTLYLKSMNLVKAVIRHLPQNTQVEDISDGLVDLRF
jgi:hypothetical protein